MEPKTPPQIPFDPEFPCVLDIDGVEFYVHWPSMKVGSSAFLRTLKPPKKVQKLLRPVEQYWDIQLTCRSRCEFGFHGVRVWRIG